MVRKIKDTAHIFMEQILLECVPLNLTWPRPCNTLKMAHILRQVIQSITICQKKISTVLVHSLECLPLGDIQCNENNFHRMIRIVIINLIGYRTVFCRKNSTFLQLGIWVRLDFVAWLGELESVHWYLENLQAWLCLSSSALSVILLDYDQKNIKFIILLKKGRRHRCSHCKSIKNSWTVSNHNRKHIWVRFKSVS